MGFQTPLPFDEIRTRGSIRDSDVLRLRRALSDASAMSAEDADALLRLDQCCAVKDPSWAGFMVEALTDFVVHQMKPDGYVESAKARWLTSRIAREGRIESHAGLALLVDVIERARWSPPSLIQFALAQIRCAVERGVGPLRRVHTVEPGTIQADEVELARRILLGFAGDGAIAVTRAEADALVDIDRAIAPGRQTAEWTALYVNAIGTAVLSGLGHAVPPRSEALQAEPWTACMPASNAQQAGAGCIGQSVAGGAGSVWASARIQSPEERALARLERQRLEIITSERIEDADEAWLLARFDTGNHPAGDSEHALLAFIEREASSLPQPVRALVSRAKIAA